MPENNQFEMHFPSNKENVEENNQKEKKLFSDHKIRIAVEKDSEKMTFGNFTGSELFSFREKYRKFRDEKVNDYYRAAARALYNEPEAGHARRFEKFESFFSALSKSTSIMKNEIEMEIAKREVEEENKFKGAKQHEWRNKHAA